MVMLDLDESVQAQKKVAKVLGKIRQEEAMAKKKARDQELRRKSGEIARRENERRRRKLRSSRE